MPRRWRDTDLPGVPSRRRNLLHHGQSEAKSRHEITHRRPKGNKQRRTAPTKIPLANLISQSNVMSPTKNACRPVWLNKLTKRPQNSKHVTGATKYVPQHTPPRTALHTKSQDGLCSGRDDLAEKWRENRTLKQCKRAAAGRGRTHAFSGITVSSKVPHGSQHTS